MSRVYINTEECEEIARLLADKSKSLSRIATGVQKTLHQIPGWSCNRTPTSWATIDRASKMAGSASDCIYESVGIYTDAFKALEDLEWIRKASLPYTPVYFSSGLTIVPNMNDKQKKLRDDYIQKYEKLNPDEAKAINDFFENSPKEGITQDDIDNIKALAYSSPSPYHEKFFEHIQDCKVFTWQRQTASGYGRRQINSQDTNSQYIVIESDGEELENEQIEYEYGIFFNIENIRNKDGYYVTFFHEIFHEINDQRVEWDSEHSSGWNYEQDGFGNKNEKKFYTDSTQLLIDSGEGKGLHEVLYSDLTQYLSGKLDRIAAQSSDISPELKLKLLDSLLDGRKRWTTLSIDEYAIYDRVRNEIENSTELQVSGVSDIVGGLTNNTTAGRKDVAEAETGANRMAGHERISSSGNPYWYKGNTPTYKQANEFFSECAGYAMTGQTEKYESFRRVFPNAVKQIEEQMSIGKMILPDTDESHQILIEKLTETYQN